MTGCMYYSRAHVEVILKVGLSDGNVPPRPEYRDCRYLCERWVPGMQELSLDVPPRIPLIHMLRLFPKCRPEPRSVPVPCLCNTLPENRV